MIDLRGRRKRAVRATTTGNPDRVFRRELELLKLQNAVEYPKGLIRPRTRAECCNGPRPCPWTACKHHLYLDVTIGGSVKLNFPDLEPHQLTESCVLDVADRGGESLERVGELMNLTRERIRQLENSAVRRFSRNAEWMGVDLEAAL